MKNLRFTMTAVAVTVFALAFASSAQAQATRTWVSGVGDDANPCSRTAPCKTWAGAISKTAAGGEMDALDPGGFGALTITKAITIDGSGTLTSVLVSGTNAFVVEAGGNDVVTIRGVTFQGLNGSASAGLNGIRFLSGKALNIVDCFINGFSQNGIDIALAAAGERVSIINTTVKNSTGDGVAVTTSSGQVLVTIVNSNFLENGNGLHAKAGARVMADHCTFSNSPAGNGVLADNMGGSTGVANITNSTAYNNALSGILAATGGVVRINNMDIIQNIGTGAFVNGGEIDTWNNNRIIFNGADGCAGCMNVTFSIG